MDKKTWINIGLLSAIVILSIILLSSEEKQEQPLPRLSEIDQDTITNIDIIRKNLENFSFTKTNNVWYMQSPLQYKVNSARINAMLRMINVESHGQLNPEKHDLKHFGLAEPAIIMQLNDHEFRFGGTDAIDQRRYVLFNDVVHLTNDFLYQQLTTNAAFFAALKLLPDDFEISSIQFPDNSLSLVDDKWQLETLQDIKPEQLKRYVFNWKSAMAISASRYAEPETPATVIITNKDNEFEFVIVATEPHLILGRKDLGIQYHMGSDDSEKLLLKEATDPEQTASE